MPERDAIDTPAKEKTMEPKTFADLIHYRVARSANELAFRYRKNGQWTSATWREVGERIRSVACGLHTLDLEKGNCVAILAATSYPWILADGGILCGGYATTTIYASNTPEECRHILANSEARVCIAGDASQVAKLLTIKDELEHLQAVIVIDGNSSDDGFVLSLAELESRGQEWDAAHPEEYDRRAAAIEPDDLATLIYTSGTTGKPKGVMLSHDCWVFEAQSLEEQLRPLTLPTDVQYLFLPLAHSFGKILELMAFQMGMPTAVDGDINNIVHGLREIQPTFMAAVPRVFEKIYNKVVTQARAAGPLRYRIFQWAVSVGAERATRLQKGQPIPGILALKGRIADRLVLGKIRAALGGNIRCFMSGGAPLSKEIAEFFHGAGLLILEGYGLTESSAASVANHLEMYKFGTVGLPVPGVGVKIAEDGEVLLSGRGIMQGYYKMPDATAEVIRDGWFHTGDIGSLDSDGFLSITGRKKDLIITAGGKNIAPQVIENRAKALCPYINEIAMHGDRRNFCVALVWLDEEAIQEWGNTHDLAGQSYAQYAKDVRVNQLVQGYVDKLNAELAPYETIKYIHLLDQPISQETGELTPTMKLKRNIVEAKYKDVLDSYYSETVAAL
jgi:long-chain acyl-CoA synthetase